MLVRTLTIALLGLAIACEAHADRVPAGSQFIAQVVGVSAGTNTPKRFDALRFEIGFAKPVDAATFVPGTIDAPLFGQTRLTASDTDQRFVATAQNSPPFF